MDSIDFELTSILGISKLSLIITFSTIFISTFFSLFGTSKLFIIVNMLSAAPIDSSVLDSVLIFTLKSEKTEQINVESTDTDVTIVAADSILQIINNLEVPKSEKNVEIKIVEKVVIKDNFESPRIELDARSIEVVNRSFEEYDYLRDTIYNLNKNYSELILKCKKLEKENDSIEILLNKEMEKMNAVKKTKAGQRILKRIQ